MSFRRLVVVLTFLGLFTMALRVSTDSDTWWHLRAGTWILDHRQILEFDPFSLTRMGSAWVYPGWLAQVAMAAVYGWLGYAGLNLLTAAMVTLAFVFLWRTLEGPGLWRAAVVLLAAATSAVYWSARPHIFSFALAGAYLWILERWRQEGGRCLWVLPPLMAFWANLHGGFAIGMILIGLYWLAEMLDLILPMALGSGPLLAQWRARRSRVAALTAAAALSTVAIALNPAGPVMILYPFKTVSIGVLRDYIQEWQSPNFHRLEVQPFLWMLLAAVLALAVSRQPPQAAELLSLLTFAYLGFLAGRNIAPFALAAAPLLARHGYAVLGPIASRVGPGRQVPERPARWINLGLLVLVIVGAVAKSAVPLSNAQNEAILAGRAPLSAVQWIRTHQPPGPLFNSYNWGGLVVWALYPDYPSFVDGRTDLFDQELLTEYLTAWRAAPGWEAVLERWGIGLVLLEPEAPLVLALRCAGWGVAYQDDQAVVLMKGGDDG